MALPTFLIIGAARAGTTSLYHYFRGHPEVFMSAIKEVNFFSPDRGSRRSHVRDLAEYEELFRGAGDRKAIGEASPSYLPSPAAPGLIAKALPGVRLIAILRNPAERAWSDWQGRVRAGVDLPDPDAYLRPGSRTFQDSLYYDSVSRYMARFPGEQLKLLLFDDLTADPAGVMRDLFAFVGVDPSAPVDTATRHNETGTPRSESLNRLVAKSIRYLRRHILPHRFGGTGLGARFHRMFLRDSESMPPELRARLLDDYHEDILRTSKLIGRDLSHWLRPRA